MILSHCRKSIAGQINYFEPRVVSLGYFHRCESNSTAEPNNINLFRKCSDSSAFRNWFYGSA
jgi:hypothetical protein